VDVATLLAEPWAISEQGLELVIAIASRDEFFAEVREQALAAKEGVPLENTHKVTTRGQTAIIPVAGPMFRHANLMTRVSGATSYATLRKDLQSALEDPSVASIVLNIDSPGGEANGVSELADAIRAACEVKPVVAYVGGTGASAAYWIAAACSKVVVSQTAMLGSIGVLSSVVKSADGKRTVEFVSSQSPYKRPDLVSEEGIARIQRRVDDLAEVFIDSVAKFRGVSKVAVLERFGRGDVMIASRAVENGLADRIGDFESVVAELNRAERPNAGAPYMKTALLLAFGLAADASDDAVVAFAKNLKDQNGKLTEKCASLEAEKVKLEGDVKASALSAREKALDEKIKAFAVDPSERAELLELAQESPAMFDKLLAKRLPRNPGGPRVEVASVLTGASRVDAAEKAIDAELAADPSITPSVAMQRAAEKNPALFAESTNAITEGA